MTTATATEKKHKVMLLEQGDNMSDVTIEELHYVYNKEKDQNEIILLEFKSVFKTMKKRQEFTLTEYLDEDKGIKGEKRKFVAKDVQLNYHFEEVEQKENSFRHLIVRTPITQIILETEEEAERKKLTMLRNKPLVFLKGDDSFEDKQILYTLVKNNITTPMVVNMLQPIILGGQLFESKETAELVLKKYHGEKVTGLASSVYKRGFYLINVYKKWVDVIYDIMLKHDFLTPLQTAVTNFPKDAYQVEINEAELEKIISENIRDGELKFTEGKAEDTFDGFNEYMFKMAKTLTARIESVSKPIHRKGDIRPFTQKMFDDYIVRTPYKAQVNIVEAMLKALDLRGNVTVIGEMGVGKTYMMSATQIIHAKMHGKTLKLLVLAPDHLVKSTWTEEINKINPEIQIHRIDSVSTLQSYEAKGYLNDDSPRVFLLSQTNSKSGLVMRPSAKWSKHRQRFECPTCGKPIMKKIKVTKDGVTETIEIPKSFLNFTGNPTEHNYKCPDNDCQSILWEPSNGYTDSDSNYVYIPTYGGYIPRDSTPIKKEIREVIYRISSALDEKEKNKFKRELKKLKEAEQIVEGDVKEMRRRAKSAAPVADYIFKKLRYRFTHLVIDELHEFQGDSKRSEACAKLVNSIKYITAGTGTGMNGYADSRFRTDYMLNPEKMKKAGYKITDAARYQADFGVIEKTYRIHREGAKVKKESPRPNRKPGISPVIFPLFMQDTTVFVSMEDMSDELPPLTYIPMPVTMSPELKKAHDVFMEEVREVTRDDKSLFKTAFQTSYSFLDAPQQERDIIHPLTNEVLVKTPFVEESEDRKLHKLLEVAHDRIILKEKKMLVYTHFSGAEINEYLAEHLLNEGYKVTILQPKNKKSRTCDGEFIRVEKEDRELFLRNEAKKGTQIVLTNPELVKTGTNLIEYPVIVNYQMGYQVYTVRQADRRAWRLGQTSECEVINIFYEDTIQHSVATLMATKIVAARSIEGKMDADGLEALSDSRTAEEEMAAVFYDGFKDAIKK